MDALLRSFFLFPRRGRGGKRRSWDTPSPVVSPRDGDHVAGHPRAVQGTMSDRMALQESLHPFLA
jgi:hypothetical protein